MRAIFNPSGTNVKGSLKVRIDFYPEKEDVSYPRHHVYVPIEPDEGFTGDPAELNDWINKLPHVRQTNPCFSHFMSISEVTSVKDINDYIINVFDEDTIATIDHVLTLPDSAHYMDSIIKAKPCFSVKAVRASDLQDLCSTVNEKLSNTAISLKKGKVLKVDPQSITVGAGAANYNNSRASGNTYIEGDNAFRASGTGLITVAQFWANANIGGMRYGMFYPGGGGYTCRDSAVIGAVVAGSVQTFTGLAINVVILDRNGCYYTSGLLESDIAIGAAAMLYANPAGEFIDPADFSAYLPSGLNRVIALYGTGGQMVCGNLPHRLVSTGVI